MTRWLPFTHSTRRKGPHPTTASGFPLLRSSSVYFCAAVGEWARSWREKWGPHAVRGQHVQHEPVRLLESDLDGVRIEDLDRVHVLGVGPHAGPRRGVADAV